MLQKEQLKIGITGGIGSGKTFVSNIFSKLGIPVFNADSQAKNYMAHDSKLINKIQNIFGYQIYENGILQKESLAKLIFNNKNNLEKLNQLVHPLVKKKFNHWCKEQTSKIVIKETAILFESNSHLDIDKIICISSNLETRVNRVILRDNTSREKVLSRVRSQMSQDQKEKLSDFVILNDGIELLLPQIIKIIAQIG